MCYHVGSENDAEETIKLTLMDLSPHNHAGHLLEKEDRL